MERFLYDLTTIAVAAVFCVLVMGLWNLFRTRDAALSQRLMRWRVGLQFVAIVIIVLYQYIHAGA